MSLVSTRRISNIFHVRKMLVTYQPDCFFFFFFVRHCQFENFLLCERIFDKCHNLSKRNVKLILKILTNLESFRGSSNKKTLDSTRSCVNWAVLGTRGPLKKAQFTHELVK
jgi:hypothetical protein